MQALTSKSKGGIYYREIHGDKVPADAIKIDAKEVQRLTLGVAREMTRDDVEAARLSAYADPQTGSDRHFAEAMRLQAMGAPESEVKAAKEKGAARYSAIQAELPYPE